jgi:DNA-binding transcriptional LysR family regulator
MNLLKFHILELLEKHKKITAVAEELGLTQPTVSFHLKNLEKEFGVQLFEALSGRILLTEAGQSLLHYAVKINSLAREAGRAVKEFDTLGRGILIIGASYVPGTYILPGILSGFSNIYPQVSISLTIRTMPVIQEMLLNHQIDIGIVSTEAMRLSTLKSEKLCEDELVVIFSLSHPFAGYSQLKPEQLGEMPFILHGQDSSTRRMTIKWAEDNQIKLNGHMECDSLEAMKRMVMSGSWIGFISRLAVKEEVERGQLRYHTIPHNSFKRNVYYCYNPERRQSALLNRFSATLTKAVQ